MLNVEGKEAAPQETVYGRMKPPPLASKWPLHLCVGHHRVYWGPVFPGMKMTYRLSYHCFRRKVYEGG